ncbi:ABC-three component system middle component 1 [Paracoccus marcusii]|uniref:ABC-three component system middle component 1 n=1 Tax=Paracoccus marcusii TaxID=59779 RepID=UPI0038B70D2A
MTDGVTLSSGLVDFTDRLFKAAVELGLAVANRPELASSSFNGGSTKSTSLSPADLPAESHAVRIDRFNIVLGLLPEIATLEAVRETLRRYRNQCVVARSYLASNETLDLQLMLLGPRASERQEAWRALALMVERDDRVARKLAWLRPEDDQSDEASFADFLKRTFLARPWEVDEDNFEDAALDELSSGVPKPGLPRTLAEEWERIALDEKKTPDEIVTALVKAWERRGQA